ncbi:MAG: DUF2764 family protein [Pseudomonadota bacterium]
MKYYFLASYLPEIHLEDRRMKYPSAELFQERFHIAPRDWREVDLVLLRGDVSILEALLAGKTPKAAYSLFDPNYWSAQLKSPSEGPDFLVEFLRDRGMGPMSAAEIGALYLAYLEYVRKNSSRKFLKDYFQLEMDLRNVAAALRARKKGWDPANHLVGEGDLVESAAVSKADDFGLTQDYPWVETLLAAGSPREIQEAVEKILWESLESARGADPFDFDNILAYLLKAQILEKRLSLNEEQGLEIVQELEGR